MWRRFSFLLLAPLVVLNGCIRPTRLSESCRVARSDVVWTATGFAGRIEGRVTEFDGGIPVGNIEIQLANLDRRQRTTGQGMFRFDSVPEGRHVLLTEGSVYQARGDTLMLQPEQGMNGQLRLSTRRSVLQRCPLYKP